MRVLVAGATGAIGRPLIRQLVAAGHEVIGMTTSETGAQTIVGLGGTPVIADALRKPDVLDTVASSRAEAIVNELTSLPKQWSPDAMRDAAQRDRDVRITGNANLIQAAEDAGVRRFVVQSTAFWYGPGEGLAGEDEPFAFDAPGRIAEGCRVYAELERMVLSSRVPERTVLRYGFFYGPGTWYARDGSTAEAVRRGQSPIIGGGGGVWSYIHVEDAAAATVAALSAPAGVYNIVDDNPAPQHTWLTAYARWLGAPAPGSVAAEAAKASVGEDTVYYATSLRGASNAKARKSLGFRPRPLEWLASEQSPNAASRPRV